jgi:hypothetical protein
MKKKSEKKIILEAIRENCLDCMVDPEINYTRETASARVARCPMTCCPLYQYRYGSSDNSSIAEI